MGKTIKHKKVKGKITVLKKLLYKDNVVVIRKINDDIFEWILVFKNDIYSSYLIMKPRKGEKKLSEEEIDQVSGLLWSGATTTIDMLLGETLDKKTDKLSKEKQKVVKAFQENGKAIEA